MSVKWIKRRNERRKMRRKRKEGVRLLDKRKAKKNQ